eukprot:3872377-Pyramimonas_sp.AAC.1
MGVLRSRFAVPGSCEGGLRGRHHGRLRVGVCRRAVLQVRGVRGVRGSAGRTELVLQVGVHPQCSRGRVRVGGFRLKNYKTCRKLTHNGTNYIARCLRIAEAPPQTAPFYCFASSPVSRLSGREAWFPSRLDRARDPPLAADQTPIKLAPIEAFVSGEEPV